MSDEEVDYETMETEAAPKRKGRGHKSGGTDTARYAGKSGRFDDVEATDAGNVQRSVEGYVLLVTNVHEEAQEDDEDVFYTITGNFNSWEEDRLAPGSVPGHHTITVVVPASGTLEFRFMKDGDADKVVAPETPSCPKKSVPILGPAKGLTNNWLVRAPADTEMLIELMRMKGSYSIVWLKA